MIKKLSAEVAAHLTTEEMRGTMRKFLKRGREQSGVVAHGLSEKLNFEAVSRLCVGSRGHDMDGRTNERGMVHGAGPEALGWVAGDCTTIRSERPGGPTRPDDGAGGGCALRKKRRRCISSDEEEAAEKSELGC